MYLIITYGCIVLHYVVLLDLYLWSCGVCAYVTLNLNGILY